MPARASRLPLILAMFSAASLLCAQSLSWKLNPGKMPPVAHIDDRFQSYNIEMVEVTGGRFWAPYRSRDQAEAASTGTKTGAPAGMPANLFRHRDPIDLSNPRLQRLAAALGPAYVRVSGTWANSTFFQDSDDPAPDSPPPGFNSVLTRRQWKGVLDFSHAVDARLVTSFAVSAGTRDANGTWVPAEARKLLDYTQRAGGEIAAAELFNEPTYATIGGAPQGYDAVTFARDFRAFHQFIGKAAPDLLVLGPGPVGEGGSLPAMPGMKTIRTEDILKQDGTNQVDAFSYHFYGAVSQRCAPRGAPGGTTPEAALTEKWLELTARDEAFYASLRDRYVPGKPLWVTETGEAACGGDPWASSFLDSFRYLIQLGILAHKGVQVVMHNTLAASDYGLLEETTLDPRPNYWSALLWRRLMGTTVLDPGPSPQPGLYLYAHCVRGAQGGVTILAINADKDNKRFISLLKSSTRYTLTATDLLGSEVQLNGQKLTASEDGSLPAINGTPERSHVMELPPASINFFAITQAKNAACRR